ncbi:hypothetical protein [Skermania piniformis]|uniref:Uncharacterized protein n=1 Tax=Skermania pinensis TaxID=39122 RepID=A0ABX8SCW9_9ACTN|nr:hypothetical protein [Skermania piniformis]QXQ15012.1 hypothetical protein KV203_06555 [Skermania piniformis]
MRACPPRAVRISAVILAAPAAALLAGCAAPHEQAGTLSSPALSPTTGVPQTTADAAPPAGTASVTPTAGDDLCRRLEAALPDWRVQGPTLGKLALKGLAFEWAANNGYANVELLRDHTVFDTVAGDRCANVRQETLAALSIPSLDAGIYAL